MSDTPYQKALRACLIIMWEDSIVLDCEDAKYRVNFFTKKNVAHGLSWVVSKEYLCSVSKKSLGMLSAEGVADKIKRIYDFQKMLGEM